MSLLYIRGENAILTIFSRDFSGATLSRACWRRRYVLPFPSIKTFRRFSLYFRMAVSKPISLGPIAVVERGVLFANDDRGRWIREALERALGNELKLVCPSQGLLGIGQIVRSLTEIGG